MNKGKSLDELLNLQAQSETLQSSLDELFLEASELEMSQLEEFMEKLKERGLTLPHELIRDIKRELSDIREKQVTIQELQGRVNLLRDLIELKKGVIDAFDNEDIKKIFHEQKITEILLKNRLIIEMLIWTILKLVEVKILDTKIS